MSSLRWLLPLLTVTTAAWGAPQHTAPAPWSLEQIQAFFQAAAVAERLPDRLHGCLAYPDPPGSHWSRKAVEAACRYYLTPSALSQDEILDLIRRGRTAELDRRLTQILQDQRTGKVPPETLDMLYIRAFLDVKKMRLAVDRWKKAAPHSAFALAASGQMYVTQAGDARGTESIGDTPQSSVDAMDRLIARAKADLERAVQIEPHLTPAWVAMIDAGIGDGAYAHSAAKRASAIEPLDFAIYAARTWLAQPKWGGSDAAMEGVAREALAHARANPLLELYRADPPAIAIGLDECGCHTDADPGVFQQVFDQAARPRLYLGAGKHALAKGRPDIAGVYFSEALRFDQGESHVLAQRNQGLLSAGAFDFALESANRRLASHPDEEESLAARAMVHSYRHDEANVEKDTLRVLAITKNDLWALTQLGYSYVFNTQEWNKALAIADRLVREYPDNPDGLYLRAQAQAGLHDPRLKETVAAFEAKFGRDSAQQHKLMQLRGFLLMVPQEPKR